LIRCSIEERREGAVARLVIDNPAKLNILNPEALAGLTREIRDLPDRVRAVVISGAGSKAFIGGADLAVLGSLRPDSAREFISLIHGACAAIRECPVPVLASINGWCLGAGLELAAACDLRIASEDARFGMPEVRLGIPSVVEAALLPRLIGHGRSRWLVMTGETVDAQEALAWGLIEKAVKQSELENRTNQTLDALLAGTDAAMRAQKRLCKLWEEAPLAESIRVSIDEFARAYAIDEPRERIAEFRAARKKK
jgi:enoyl-CoA hydratase